MHMDAMALGCVHFKGVRGAPMPFHHTSAIVGVFLCWLWRCLEVGHGYRGLGGYKRGYWGSGLHKHKSVPIPYTN